MADTNIAVLVDAKNEYTTQLINLVKPSIYQGIMSIYEEAKDICDQDNNPNNILITFQEQLTQIPKWSTELIQKQYKSLVDDSQCDWIEDLITAVFISHTKVLTIGHKKKKNNKVNLKLPKATHFVHLCYIESAREFWKNPYLFSERVSQYEHQKSMRDAENIISTAVKETIRKQLPVKHILREYLGESYHSEGEDDEEENDSKIKQTITKKEKINLKKLVDKELENDKKNNQEDTSIETNNKEDKSKETSKTSEKSEASEESIVKSEVKSQINGDVLNEEENKNQQNNNNSLNITNLDDNDNIDEIENFLDSEDTEQEKYTEDDDGLQLDDLELESVDISSAGSRKSTLSETNTTPEDSSNKKSESTKNNLNEKQLTNESVLSDNNVKNTTNENEESLNTTENSLIIDDSSNSNISIIEKGDNDEQDISKVNIEENLSINQENKKDNEEENENEEVDNEEDNELVDVVSDGGRERTNSESSVDSNTTYNSDFTVTDIEDLDLELDEDSDLDSDISDVDLESISNNQGQSNESSGFSFFN